MNVRHKIVFIFTFTIISMSFIHPENTVRGLLRSSNISPADIYANQWALIIGINKYHDFPQLNFAVEDAKSMKTLLNTQYGFPEENIQMLLDEQATKNNITDAFYTLVEKTGPDDAIVVFYAGHGETLKTPGGKEDRGYLIPIDGKMGSIPRTAISMKTINIHANEIPAKSMLFLVDACYGGLAAVGNYRSNRQLDIIKGLTKDRCRQIITAGKKDEPVVENEKWQHSAFTRVLLDGLMQLKADTDNDGIVMANQLFSYVQHEVLKLTGGSQTPQFNNLSADEGEFAFIDQNLVLSDFDIDLSGFSFLTIPYEPFGAFIKIDDKVIDKKTPIINEKIKSGYHTITIFKKGYKEFAKRYFFKPNETTEIHPVMSLFEGILSFSSLPRNSLISIDGVPMGSTPLENINLEQGRYIVEVGLPGYEKLPAYDLNVDSSMVYSLTLPRLVPKTRVKAFMRSAVLPGWGQRYFEQPRKSIGIGSSALTAALFCLYNQMEYNRLSTDYDQAVADYQNSITDLDTRANHMLNIYDQLSANQRNSNLGLVLLSGVYVWNLVDIFIANPFNKSSSFSQSNIEPEVKAGFTPNGVQLRIGINF